MVALGDKVRTKLQEGQRWIEYMLTTKWMEKSINREKER